MKTAPAIGIVLLAVASAAADAQVRRSSTVTDTARLPLPSVSRAHPASVTLRAGGPSQTLTLEGLLLTRATGAHVELNGARVSGIQVELQPTTDATRRALRLSAQATIGAPWNAPLDLVLEALRVPVRTTIKVYVAPAKVDLSVDRLRFWPSQLTTASGLALQFDLVAATQSTLLRSPGEAPYTLPAGPVAWRLNGPGWSASGVLDRMTSSRQTVSVPLTGQRILGDGAHAFTVSVDPDNAVTEVNEANNQASSTLILYAKPGNYADLIISRVVTPIAMHGTPYEFVAYVRNLGRDTIGVGSPPWMPGGVQPRTDTVRVSGTTCGAQGFTVPVIVPGQESQIRIRPIGKELFMGGNHTCTFTVTLHGGRADPVMTNNTFTVSWTVAHLPDLTISGLTATPASGPSGAPFVFRITVTNAGRGDTSQARPVDCAIDGVAILKRGVTDVTWRFGPTTVAANASIVHEITYAAPLTPGTKRLECVLDQANALRESSESNNTRSITFTVTSN